MKDTPLVSIIMSEYNTDEKLLLKSIESIIKQTYKNIELILIDDCGKNDVKKIVAKINDPRIKVYKNKENRGLVYSLNEAIKKSNGEYIARMDTDDYSYSQRIELQVNFMKKNPKYDIVGTRCDFYDGNNIWGESNDYGVVTKEKMLQGCPLIHPSIIYKKNVINQIGGYLNYNRCEDYATWIEAYTKGYNIFVLKDKLIRYHLSKEDYKKRTLKTRKGFFKMLKHQYIKLNPTKKQIVKIKLKAILAGIIPYNIIFRYHQKKFKKAGCKNEKR